MTAMVKQKVAARHRARGLARANVLTPRQRRADARPALQPGVPI